MRISVIGWELPPAFSGGLGVHTINIFSIINKIFDVTLYIPDVSGLYPYYPFRVKRVKTNYKINEKNIRNESYYTGFDGIKFHDFNEKIKYYNEMVVDQFDPETDIIHCHDWITFEAGIELKERYNKPLVITVHSTEIDRSGNFFPQKYIMDIERRGIKYADRIIAVSEYTQKMIIKYYNADPKKIYVVHNGIDNTFINMPQKSYDLYRNILYFGRITTQKGPRFFLDAAYRVIKKFPDIKFTFAGTGDQEPEMRRITGELGINRNVIFRGFVSFNEQIYYYKNSDVFLLPAVSEPFGMSVIEAMSTGTPAIISYTTGVGEALHNVFRSDYWDTELLSEYIISMLLHRGLRETMGINGQIEARKFTWESAAIKTMEVYRSI
ncbi:MULTISPECIES: glycosyltransferase family 4 protein [Acidiplasma]|uniref:Glycosyl transferase n=1 Tax=Acidiplasma cupricumulans TaxID=312540 RepID=A0A0Q0VR55_9ARCH|nr:MULTISPECIES: glycosyltransferase family 4 protein [Acidiplasma]KJE49254.1 glycosyl transferase [Acidiplasma sp. MBA-1]KQB36366.1 glycosyl transferase [Acidiplasma cupricumulans]WMT54777.1 MAG: glycosyltransferase family 4 protein [Acidiplasma sp.]